MKIWLDDVRDAPDDSWTVARSYGEAIDFLSYGGNIEAISLDHDIGYECRYKGLELNRPFTGYDVALWIENKVNDDVNYFPPKIFVHTDNPVGRANINAAITNIKKMMEELYQDWRYSTPQSEDDYKWNLG